MIRKLLKIKLAFWVKCFIWRFQPKIVAITGSVGKTSTKEAIAKVLENKFQIRKSKGNYNNEIGVPLAILGEESAGKNLFLWSFIFLKSFVKLFSKSYPEILILELGTDRAGDINYLVNLLGKIDVAVITDIGISHLEFFGSPAELAREKLSLIKKLQPANAAVLNFDNIKIFEGKNQTKAQVIGYGFSNEAQLRASDFHLIQTQGVWGANFKVHFEGNVVPFFLPQVLGRPGVYAALAAASVGLRFNINLVHASEALKQYESPPGRMKLLAGIKHTQIIDDTYNAAPSSAIAALDALKEIAQGRKVVVMGSMAELGAKNDAGHREVAEKIMEVRADLVFLVGIDAKIIQNELDKRKYWGRVIWFNTSDEARLPIQNAILEGDMILVKGSQAVRMEKIVKEIMADPMNAEKLLVRQGPNWD